MRGLRPSSGLRAGVALALTSAAVLACNAILGVEDVTPRSEDGGRRGPAEESSSSGEEVPTIEPEDAGPSEPADRGALALGFLHGCARLGNGTVRCWGDNGAGQLGLGVAYDAGTFEEESLVALPVPGIDDATSIGSGGSHTCVVRRGGKVACWGLNSFGQLGDGTEQRSPGPVNVASVTDAVLVAGGTSFTCAIRATRNVLCWGANYSGQLGDGTKESRTKVAPVNGLANAVGIGLGLDHACAVVEDGTLSCWGGNTAGQLGVGSTTESLTPVKVALPDVVQVSAASRFTCARQRTGAVHCWGENDYGQLGTGTTSATPATSPKAVTAVTDAIQVWAGLDHACAVRKEGAVVCWGRAGDGQVGAGAAVLSDAAAPKPAAVSGGAAALGVWTAGQRSCSLVAGGRAFCWGANTVGQLGNGTKDRSYAATPVKNLP